MYTRRYVHTRALAGRRERKPSERSRRTRQRREETPESARNFDAVASRARSISAPRSFAPPALAGKPRTPDRACLRGGRSHYSNKWLLRASLGESPARSCCVTESRVYVRPSRNYVGTSRAIQFSRNSPFNRCAIDANTAKKFRGRAAVEFSVERWNKSALCIDRGFIDGNENQFDFVVVLRCGLRLEHTRCSITPIIPVAGCVE